MALAWKLRTVMGYNDNQWCTDSHWVLYFVFCCPLCNGWLEELIHLFASCVVQRQNLLLLHILNLLARLAPFANKMWHFDHECHCFGLGVNRFENVEFELTAASKQSRKSTECHLNVPLVTAGLLERNPQHWCYDPHQQQHAKEHSCILLSRNVAEEKNAVDAGSLMVQEAEA